jgi:type IV secretory pathway TrbL component
MKSTLGFWLVMTVLAVPVHAGQGTIEETETAIIVEYTGDASDRPVEAVKTEATAAVPKSRPPVELPATASEATASAAVKKDMSVRETKANMSDTQRQKRAVREAAKAVRNSARQNQQEPD